MKANKYISKKEYKLLLITASIIFIAALSNITIQVVEKYNNYVSESQEKLERQANKELTFEIYTFERGNPIPFLNVVSIFIFLILWKTKRFVFSLILTLFTFVVFAYEFFRGFKILIYHNPIPEFSLYERLNLIGNSFDYAIFLFVSVLLFWQISILLRILVKTLQRKPELP